MKAEKISENPLKMRWVEGNFIKVDSSGSVVLAVCDIIGEKPYVGFVWISGVSPTNMIEHLAGFVWRTRYSQKEKIGFFSRMLEAINFSKSKDVSFDDVKWFDIQRPYYERENVGQGPNYFSYKSVYFEDGKPEWGSRTPFSKLPGRFQDKIEKELVVAAKIMGVGK